ncbi:MAG: hypothetical protein LBI91_00845 [Spirochaetaceae bacterium]|nr:hypothetical protein [Spirochaetaceae bacterium]
MNNRQTFPETAGEEPALMPVSTSIEWGGERLYDGPPGFLPGGLYSGDTVGDHPFLFFADDDDEDIDDGDDDDFGDDDDSFDDDDFDDDDFDDDEEDDDDFDDDGEYDYGTDVNYDDFD